jgi:leader peptidase (prepilin peptidase)/N-methyltransferase
MLWVLASVSLVVGLALGSFVNVVVYRLPRGISVSRPRRSFCPACHTTIAARDNLPVVSWLVLSGKCRNCGTTISPRYPLIEGATGLLLACLAVALWPALRPDPGEGLSAVALVLLVFSELALVAAECALLLAVEAARIRSSRDP